MVGSSGAESVIAGVVVAVATVPLMPLAVVTETDVTVPEPPSVGLAAMSSAAVGEVSTLSASVRTNDCAALVVGATWPEQLREVRAIVGDMPFLVPGIGAQGGDVQAVVTNARSADGTGLIVSSSRAILYASKGDDYAEAAAHAARTLRDEINRYR